MFQVQGCGGDLRPSGCSRLCLHALLSESSSVWMPTVPSPTVLGRLLISHCLSGLRQHEDQVLYWFLLGLHAGGVK
ncbi:hypothetical protein ACRRTK_024409 [Alexandromys fortis]